MSGRSSNKFLTVVREKGYVVSGHCDKSITHLLLDGGKLSVPSHDLLAFNRLYSKCVTCQSLYVVEVKQTRFRMFMDVDMKAGWLPSSKPDRDSIINHLMVIFRDASARFTSESKPHMVVCKRITPHDTCEDTKVGMHVIWPEWIVCKADALRFREQLLRQLRDTDFIQQQPDIIANLDSIIDAAVFKGSGLRMIGSKKMGLDNIYLPIIQFNKDSPDAENITKPWSDIEKWINLTSIHAFASNTSPLSASGTNSPLSEPRSPLIFDKMDESDEKGILNVTYKTGMQGMPITPAVQDVIQQVKSMVPCYSRSRVTTLYKAKSGKEAVFIMGTDSKFCTNLSKNKGFHRSNHVYLLLRQTGLYQRCFCQCETLEGRKYRKCKDFEGKMIGFIGKDQQLYSTLLTLSST